jgi:hypothetical protein
MRIHGGIQQDTSAVARHGIIHHKNQSAWRTTAQHYQEHTLGRAERSPRASVCRKAAYAAVFAVLKRILFCMGNAGSHFEQEDT